MKHTSWISVLATASTIGLAGCDRAGQEPGKTSTGTVASSAAVPPPGPASDPSLPVASSVLTAPVDGATAQDSSATNPKGALSKSDESKGMPEALHGNNHSSTGLDASQDAAGKASAAAR